MKRLIVITSTILILTLALSSCAMFLADHDTFVGGEILDDDMMSEIRSKFFTEDETESTASNMTEKSNESEIITDTITDTDASCHTPSGETATEAIASDQITSEETATEISSESKKDTLTESEKREESLPNSRTVYWTEKGEVWHLTEGCRYLKNKTILSGTENEAIEAGKKRLCSSCGK